MDSLPPDNGNNNQYPDQPAENPMPENGNLPPGPDQSGDLYSAQLSPDNPMEQIPPSDNPPPTDSPPPDYNNVPPPPYEENNKGKILIIAGVILFLLIIVFFGLKLFSGRGSGSSNQSANLTYWGLWEDPAVIQPLIDSYEKSHPNVKINYTKQSPTQYRERLQAALNRGEGPDIFRFHNTWLPMFLNNFAIMPSTVYSPAEFDKTFYPVAKSDLSFNNNYYGIPLEIDGLVLLYNQDILKAANVQVPANWEDFQSAAAKITVKDQNGNLQTAGAALGTADNIAHFSDILGLMFLQNGTNLKNMMGPCSDPSTSTCATDTLTFYRKFAQVPDNVWDDTMDNSIIAFAGGKVGMILAPTWEIPTIKQINPNLNFKVAKVPELPGVNINWATYWVEGVSNRSKSQAAAWEFLKFLSSKDSMTRLYSEEAKTRLIGEPYSRVDLANTLSQDQYLGPLLSEAPAMKSFYLASNTQDNGIDDEMIKYLLDAVNSLKQGVSPQTALQTASQGFNQVLTKYSVVSVPPTTAP